MGSTRRPPPLHFPELAYDCLQCGKGCRIPWAIPVETGLLPALVASDAAEQVRSKGYVPLQVIDDQTFLEHNSEGHCVFLSEQQLCALHSELGSKQKPRQCRRFPFFPAETPDGVFMGLSFFCTAVQQGFGRPSGSHEPWLRDLLYPEAHSESPRGSTAECSIETRIGLAPGAYLRWVDYRRLEAHFQARLEETGSLRKATWDFCWLVLRLQERMDGQTDYDFPFSELIAQKASEDVVEASESLRSSFLALYVATIEVAPGPERSRAAQELAQKGSLVSARRGLLEIPPADSMHAALEGALLEPARRYLSHLVFRKYLLEAESLLTNAANLWVLVSLLELYSLLALQREAVGELSEQHFWSALDVAEAEVVTHGNVAEAAGPHLQATLLRFYGAFRPTPT